MVMQQQACKLSLPDSRPSSEVISLLFEPISSSLALLLSDSSFLLYPSLSLLSLSPPQTLIPPPSSCACFLRLHANPNSTAGRVLFVVAGPHNGGSAVLLRFWILDKNQVFVRAQVSSTQKNLICDDRIGVVVDLYHGFSLKLAGSVNVFALYSVSARKILIFGAKMGEEDDGVSVRLMKCAVIDCTVPICFVNVSFGFLFLGEDNGVRVFPLRLLVKGKIKKQRALPRRRENENLNCSLNNDMLKSREMGLQNKAIRTINGSTDLFSTSVNYTKYVARGRGGKSTGLEGNADSNGFIGISEEHHISVKHTTIKLRQEGQCGSCFVAFKSAEVQIPQSKTVPLVSIKAVSIQALSPKRFLILDSVGDIHLLRLNNAVPGSEITGHLKRLIQTMKVQMLAVLPDISTKSQTLCISDGFYSVHTMTVSDMDIPGNANEKHDIEEKLMQFSAIQAIFASEKIQDIIPLSTNAILILGQGSIFAYAIS